MVGTLQALLSGEWELEPAAAGDGGGVSGDSEGPAEKLDVTGYPANVLAPQQHPHPDYDLVGIVVGDLHLEAGDLGVGDVKGRRAKPAKGIRTVVW